MARHRYHISHYIILYTKVPLNAGAAVGERLRQPPPPPPPVVIVNRTTEFANSFLHKRDTGHLHGSLALVLGPGFWKVAGNTVANSTQTLCSEQVCCYRIMSEVLDTVSSSRAAENSHGARYENSQERGTNIATTSLPQLGALREDRD